MPGFMQHTDRKKKILFLGGAYAQIPIIKEAKDRGFYIITCDYLPGNPGHKLADEYFNVSTTDVNGIVELARNIKPDLIIAYASDPAAPTAAYASQVLDLPGNTFDSVQILSSKDLFRNYQMENGFNTPSTICVSETDNYFKLLGSLKFPFIIKPVDSSGSKGVTKIDNIEEIESAVKSAFSFSRKKRVIAEEYIDNEIADLHGDGFVVNGELVFSSLGDHIYNKKSNPFNPIGTLWPSNRPGELIDKIEKDAAEIIRGCGFKNGPVNIEARVSSDGKPYLMEIGPRSGGHFVPQAIFYSTGFNMVRASLDVMLGKRIIIPARLMKCCAYYAIHSDSDGKLVHLDLNRKLRRFIREFHQYIEPGGKVNSFRGAGAAIGILILTFESYEEMKEIINNMSALINIEIEA